jgi:cytoplasmic iron level regulating protein YaaA (DUF328/UPF0246 family)
MLILLSPAKTLDFTPTDVAIHSQPEALGEAQHLIDVMRKKSPAKVAKLMGLSASLSELNVQRYRDYATPFVLNQGAKQALLAFKGDVYREWPHDDYSNEDYAYAQSHLRILSGLYGWLRPMDLIAPYRLEMGTSLKTRRGPNLYRFWGTRITTALNEAVAADGHGMVCNLASNEYYGAVQPVKLSVPVVAPRFEDWKTDRFKIISFFAKKARGMMADWIIRNRVQTAEGLEAFDVGGYAFDPGVSTDAVPVFRRRAE